MPYVIYSAPVNATAEVAFEAVRDKIENPKRYNIVTQEYQILEKYNDGVLRQMKLLNGLMVRERIIIDTTTRQIMHLLLDNQFFYGKAMNAVIVPSGNDGRETPIISYAIDWMPYDFEEARKLDIAMKGNIIQAVQRAVHAAKEAAEKHAVPEQQVVAVA